MWRRSHLSDLAIAVLVTAIPSGWGVHLAWKMVDAGTEILQPADEGVTAEVDVSELEPTDTANDPCAESESSRGCLREKLSQSREIEYIPDNLCTDRRGNQGIFDVVLFSTSYSWTLGRDQDIELSNIPVNLPGLLDSPTFEEYLRQAPEIFVVGVASCEGYDTDREGQIDLARNRGVRLKELIEGRRGLIRGQRKPTKHICLGVYSGECKPGDNSDQRPVILLALFERASDLAVEDCLQQVFSEDRQLWFLANEYDPGFSSTNRRLDCR